MYCYKTAQQEKERLNKKLDEKIDEMTIMIINETEHYDRSQYLQGFKQGLLDAKWILNNLM